MKRKHSSNPSRRAMRMESLENRQLLAGDVEVLGSASVSDSIVVAPTAAIVAESDSGSNSIVTQHNQLDTNRDGIVSALDALMVVNFLNRQSESEGESSTNQALDDESNQFDVNLDGRVSSFDALLVINAIDRAETLNQSGGCPCGGVGCPACRPTFIPPPVQLVLAESPSEETTEQSDSDLTVQN